MPSRAAQEGEVAEPGPEQVHASVHDGPHMPGTHASHRAPVKPALHMHAPVMESHPAAPVWLQLHVAQGVSSVAEHSPVLKLHGGHMLVHTVHPVFADAEQGADWYCPVGHVDVQGEQARSWSRVHAEEAYEPGEQVGGEHAAHVVSVLALHRDAA